MVRGQWRPCARAGVAAGESYLIPHSSAASGLHRRAPPCVVAANNPHHHRQSHESLPELLRKIRRGSHGSLTPSASCAEDALLAIPSPKHTPPVPAPPPPIHRLRILRPPSDHPAEHHHRCHPNTSPRVDSSPPGPAKRLPLNNALPSHLSLHAATRHLQQSTTVTTPSRRLDTNHRNPPAQASPASAQANAFPPHSARDNPV